MEQKFKKREFEEENLKVKNKKGEEEIWIKKIREIEKLKVKNVDLYIKMKYVYWEDNIRIYYLKINIAIERIIGIDTMNEIFCIEKDKLNKITM